MDIAVYLFVAAVLLGAGSWFVFVWAAKDGQFTDVEDIKYKVLEVEKDPDDNEEQGEGL